MYCVFAAATGDNGGLPSSVIVAVVLGVVMGVLTLIVVDTFILIIQSR